MGIDKQKKTILCVSMLMSIILWFFTGLMTYFKTSLTSWVLAIVLYSAPILLAAFNFWFVNSTYTEQEYIKNYDKGHRKRIKKEDAQEKFKKLTKVILIINVFWISCFFLSLILVIMVFLMVANTIPNNLNLIKCLKGLTCLDYTLLLLLSLFEKGCTIDSSKILIH